MKNHARRDVDAEVVGEDNIVGWVACVVVCLLVGGWSSYVHKPAVLLADCVYNNDLAGLAGYAGVNV